MAMTPQADLDATLRRLESKKHEWATLPLPQKVLLMQAMQQALADVDHEAWASDCARCQGMDPTAPANEREVAVEMLMSVSVLNGHLARLIASFRELDAEGRAQEGVRDGPEILCRHGAREREELARRVRYSSQRNGIGA